jgi:hypothetical protein
MKPTLQSLVYATLSFFLLLALNALVGILEEDNGVVTVSSSVLLNQTNYVTLAVANYTRKSIDGLILSVPSTVNLAGITASCPLQVEKLPDSVGTNQSIRLRLSGLRPTLLTTMYMPLPQNSSPESIVVLNPNEKKLHVEHASGVESPRKQTLLKAAVDACIVAVLYLVLMVWANAQMKKSAEELKSIRAEQIALREENNKAVAKMEKALNMGYRLRLLLLGRLSDSARGLEFWRNTIRKMLYSDSKGGRTAEEVINEVTATLKTYAAQERIPDFDMVKVYAAMLGHSVDAEGSSTHRP